VLAAAAALAGCSAESRKNVKDVAGNLLTLKTGTMSDLEEERGTGPFTDYAVPPEEMVDLVAAVLRTKVRAVFPTKGSLSVYAKERTGKDRAIEDYSDPWVSGVAVFVHPVAGDPSSCRVEIHATNRGAFTKGCIRWERELPPLLDDAVRHRGTTPIRPL
jgi:hypothetical protein